MDKMRKRGVQAAVAVLVAYIVLLGAIGYAADQGFYTPPATNKVTHSTQAELGLERTRVGTGFQNVFDTSLVGTIQTGATSYTQTAGKRVLCMSDTSVAGRTITILTSEMVSGRFLVAKDTSGVAGTKNITLTCEGGELIDGAATKVITTNYGATRLLSNGTAWFTW